MRLTSALFHMKSNLPPSTEPNPGLPPSFPTDLFYLLTVARASIAKLPHHQDRMELLEAVQNFERWPLNTGTN